LNFCTGKSEAAVTIKKLRCSYVEADYKHEASRGLSAAAELLVSLILHDLV